jgi:hypothetical protein
MCLIKAERTVESKVMDGLRRVNLAPICGVLAIIVAGGVVAAPAPVRAPAIQSVLNCRTIADSVQRLACFDKSVGEMAKAEQTGDLVTIDREQRRVVRRQAFGLILPALAMFDRGERPEEADRVTVTLAGAGQNAQGKWIVRLDDGAVWRQTDDSELVRRPHAGSAAVIRKGVLGSFFMTIDGQPAIRVHRDS